MDSGREGRSGEGGNDDGECGLVSARLEIFDLTRTRLFALIPSALEDEGVPFSLGLVDGLSFDDDDGDETCPRCIGGAAGAVSVEEKLPLRGRREVGGSLRSLAEVSAR